MNDAVIARLRTAVPAAWAAVVTALVANVPATPDIIVEWLNSEATVVAVIGLVTLGWHWLWSRVGPHVPDWLETVLMGHTGQAHYDR